MERLVAVIEKAQDGGISVYAEKVNGAFGYGLTEDDAKRDFVEVLSEQADYYKDIHGDYPEWHGAEIEYVYDMSGFFEAFPFINATAFANAIGINASLMRKYKSGSAMAGERQRKAIQSGYNRILERMKAVRF